MEKYNPLSHRRRIGLVGGTFDPVHYAHLAIAEEARTTLDLGEMVFIPAGEPPHKIGHPLTPAHDRLAMLQLAITSNPHFAYSRVELDRPGPSYLVDTLRILHAEWGRDIELYFVIGWDGLEELHHWHDPLGILEQLTHLVVVKRPGHQMDIEYNKQLEVRLPGIMQRLLVITAPQLDISSSDLRRRVAEKRSIKYLLPETVERYIYEHGLYQPVHGR